MQQVHLFISGFVQGIGFRQFVKSHAQELGLTGWVKNTQDGGVEIIAQGKKESLDQLVMFCKKGPPLSKITDISARFENVRKPFSGFVVNS